MDTRPPLWPAQREAARRIQSDFGIHRALEYLVGEKLLGWLRLAEVDGAAGLHVPGMVADVRATFTQAALRMYIENLRRVGRFRQAAAGESPRGPTGAGALPARPADANAPQVRRLEELLLDQPGEGPSRI